MELWSRPNGVLFRSTDNGMSWDSLFSGLPSSGYYSYFSTVLAHGDTILLGMRTYPDPTSGNGAVMRSTDGGASWSQTFSAGMVMGLAKRPSPSDVIYAAVMGGIIQSANWGLTWIPFNNALPTAHLTGLVVDPVSDTVYVCTTTHGVLKAWSYTTDVDEDDPPLPPTTMLLQNYPNPFNPITTIPFYVSQTDHVTLRVFDLLGREVACLIDLIQEPGRYDFPFDASALASGVYYYRLMVGNSTQARMMILQK